MDKNPAKVVGMASFTITKRDGTQVEILIDEEDLDLARNFSWHMAGGKKKDKTGKYAATRIDGVTHYLHRVVAQRMGLVSKAAGTEGGQWKVSIDHDNGNCLDNRRSNLLLKTRPQQMSNPLDKLRSNNTSGYRGVSLVKGRVGKKKAWMAHATKDYKSINLGWFNTAEEAAAARLAWEQEQN